MECWACLKHLTVSTDPELDVSCIYHNKTRTVETKFKNQNYQ